MITATHVITLADFQSAWRANFRSRPVLRCVFTAAGWFLILHALYALHRIAFQGAPFSWRFMTEMIPGCLALNFPAVTSSYQSWMMRKNPVIGTEARWFFTEDGYRYEGLHHKAEAKWSGFLTTSTFADCHLFYPQRHLFVWVPASAFATPEDFEALRELLRRNTKHRDFD